MSGPEKNAFDKDDLAGRIYDAKLFARTAAFVKPHWRWLLVSFSLIPLLIAAELAQPYLLKVAIDRHIAVGKPEGLGLLAGLFVVLVVGQTLVGYAQLYGLQLVGQRATTDLRGALHRHILRLRTDFFDRTPVGRLVTRVTGDVENLQEMFAAGVVTIIADAVKLVAILVMLFVLNARLALLTVATLPFLALLVEYFRRRMRRTFREIRARVAQLNAYLAEHLGGLKVVQIFGKERRTARRFGDINGAHRDAYFDNLKADASLYAVVEMLGSLAVGGVLWFGGARVASGVITFGLVVAFLEYVNKFFIPVRDLSAKWAVLQSGMASAERIFALLDVDEVEPGARKLEVANDQVPAPTAAVVFEGVRFGYRPTDLILKDLSLEVPRGSMVAVVGPTGSGKSTLVKLLTRLYEPQAGSVRIAGHDVRDLELEELRRRITVIPQDVFLFSGTVRENLGDGDDARLRDALRRVGLDDRLAGRAPVGGAPHDILDTIVQERGANFSAGERQLLAFARALVRDPEIVVLDEATAQVDPEAELRLDLALRELLHGRTALVVAHRLSTIRRADRIVVLQRGRVAEEGAHQDLVDKPDGIYARLHAFSRLTVLDGAG